MKKSRQDEVQRRLDTLETRVDRVEEQQRQQASAEQKPQLVGRPDVRQGAKLDTLDWNMQTHFERVYGRLNDLDDRFDGLQDYMNERFDKVDKRFEAVDRRFDSMQTQMDQRFDSVQHQLRVIAEAVGAGESARPSG